MRILEPVSEIENSAKNRVRWIFKREDISFPMPTLHEL